MRWQSHVSDNDERVLMALADDEADGLVQTFTIGPYSAYALVAALQLAHRHPALSGAMRAILHDIADGITRAFVPEVQAMLNRGWDE